MPKKGQPVKFGTDKKEAFLELLRQGGRRGASAVAIGISRETVRLYMKENEEFAVAVSQAEMDANELVEDALFMAATAGNTTAMQVWLYNRDPDRWADRRRHELELTGPIKIKVEYEDAESKAEKTPSKAA